jgi:glycosyltransferase involved in cell wall biosynthesis
VKTSLVSIIVPALNEAESLRELSRRIESAMAPTELSYELILVDDGSMDATWDVITELWNASSKIQAIRHSRNHGKSMALMQGFDIAQGDMIVTLDADLQDQPEEIPRLLAALENGYDLVNGWRNRRQDTIMRRLVSGIYNFLVNLLFGCKVHDVNCGLKAMRREVVERIELRGGLHRIIPAIAAAYGFRVGEVSVSHASRKYGSSKYHLFRLEGLFDLVSFVSVSATQHRPFYIFSLMGAGCLLMSLIAFILFIALGSVYSRPSLLALAIGIGTLIIGGFLPVFGLMIEILASNLQGRQWRRRLVVKDLPPRNG